ncbi:MAG: hypothetical protein A2925_00025 [Candidatus Yanofskybacteria bacterium RIFCSPLOWO2_01_FULL_44_22]|uniref:Uncharacterized protein n=1 Tax=Candidatus Yanofskybacteria bacterium RIFCSPLOWO2_01_FULL_44_22 TaxID=1802697 RepID=A0A1F8GL02_9BACT|nr:MAG: hypothetical protein A2925_00025 [Candidatus Yanofskybacteria bacterium RIFCSPLOWO2_01_FULL_44_22]
MKLLNLVARFVKKFRSPRGFLPRPLLRADKIQKQISLGFAKIHIPRKQFSQNRVRIEAPPHCLNIWKAEPQKEKCPFHFQKKSGARKSEKRGTFFLFGVAE